MTIKTIVLFVDGGCKGNGKVNARAYGSFAVEFDGKKQEVQFEDRTGDAARFEFPQVKTAPQAEYSTLIKALTYLNDLAGRMLTKEFDPREYTIEIRMDSEMVVEQVNGDRKSEKMAKLARQATSMMETARASFRKVNLIWVERAILVEQLGH